ncbi:MAG: P1 family peptidase [Deltaproteobacteria bacterium]|nr:P1 family peptidase [Deltaproteobacteria bacterium]
MGIGRTGTPGGNYSGDIFLAFSTANDIVWPVCMVTNRPLMRWILLTIIILMLSIALLSKPSKRPLSMPWSRPTP